MADARAARALNEQLTSIDKRLNAERSLYARIQSEMETLKTRRVNAAASIGAALTLMANTIIAGIQASINSAFSSMSDGAASSGAPSGGYSGGSAKQRAFAQGGRLRFANYKPGDIWRARHGSRAV